MCNKIWFEKATGAETLKFAKKADLTSLKLDVDELDIDKLKIALVDLSELSDVVKNEVVKKNVYGEQKGWFCLD